VPSTLAFEDALNWLDQTLPLPVLRTAPVFREPAILSIAQAADPPSVLGPIIKAIMTNEHVVLARIRFLDQDENCSVCGRAGDETAPPMRASGGRPLEAGGDWSRIDGSHNRVRLDPERV
jgi:hypothetical protein